MRLFNRKTLQDFWATHQDAEQPLKAWFAEVENASWQTPQDVKQRYRSADFLSNDRVVFNIGGNKYRLIVHVRYSPLFAVYIRFLGTHEEYDKIDAATV